jgi:signal transduction histidine kinase
VRLHVGHGRLELEIEDHGKGMDIDAPHRGLGVTAMRERAAIVGGTIEFECPREGGTLVRLAVPLARTWEQAVEESTVHVG